MFSTKQVVAAAGILAFLAILRNLQLVHKFSIWEPSAESPLSVAPLNVSKTGTVLNESHHKNTLIHLAIFGLGHRLIRTAAAWHLAQRLGVSKFKFNWGTCGKDHSSGSKIFTYLFGTDDWSVPHILNNNATATQPQRGRNVLVRNDVYGYIPAQTFQDHRIPLSEAIYKDNDSSFLSKIASDVELFEQMRNRFVFRDQVNKFMKDNGFHDHTVIGLHLRAGNGEETHFGYSGRSIANETTFVSNLVDIIHQFIVVNDQKPWSLGNQANPKPALIFLATDTVYLVPIFANLTESHGIKTVVLPQIRVADRQGVTFSALSGAGEKCLLGWQAMVADMILLSEVDVLVAARHSSFAQSMPLSLVLDRTKNQRGPHFCEVSDNATSMSCVQDLPTWLYRDSPGKEWLYSLHFSGTMHGDKVRHKALIHLPDTDLPKEYDHVLKFLEAKELASTEEGVAPTHTYGAKRFNPKYRNRKPTGIPNWNFMSKLDV